MAAAAAVLAIAAAPGTWAGPLALSTDQRARIAALASVYLERTGTPGLTVYIDRGGEQLYAEGFGAADLEHRVAAGPESVYAIGSITKSFTAHAVLQLVVAGRLSLDGTVARYLTDYAGPARAVTIRQLLTHTAGIPNYVTEIPALQGKLQRAALTREDVVAAFSPLPLRFEPGSAWSYSNSGYYLLGLIIERVTGRAYYDYLRDEVLKPLGITHVFTGDDREVIRDRVRGYEAGPQGLENAAPWSHLVPFAAGSLMTTAGELARYRRAVFTSAEVSTGLRALITSTVALRDGSATGYTCGALIRSDLGGLVKYSHSGEIWGFSSQHAYYPERDLTIVVLTNRKGTMPTPVSLERQVARVVLDLSEVAIRDDTLAVADLQRYVGTYRLGAIHFGPPTIGVAARDGRLWVTFGPPDDVASSMGLRAQGGGRFVLGLDDEWAFEFSGQDADGRAAQVVMSALEGRFPARRER